MTLPPTLDGILDKLFNHVCLHLLICKIRIIIISIQYSYLDDQVRYIIYVKHLAWYLASTKCSINGAATSLQVSVLKRQASESALFCSGLNKHYEE